MVKTDLKTDHIVLNEHLFFLKLLRFELSLKTVTVIKTLTVKRQLLRILIKMIITHKDVKDITIVLYFDDTCHKVNHKSVTGKL